MAQFNMLEAKTKLSKLVEAIETGKETEIVLARNGKPVARIVPLAAPEVDVSKRLGIAKGEFDDFDFEAFEALDDEIIKAFYARPILWEPPVFKKSTVRRKKSA